MTLPNFKMFDVTFKSPSTFVIAGPTSSGKTSLIFKILQSKHLLFDKAPQTVYLFYSQKQKIYEDMYAKNIVNHLIEGSLPFEDIKEMVSKHKSDPSCLIFDDGLSGISQDITRIFYELSHHSNCNVFFVTQNLFFSSKEYRTLSLNSHYMIIMKNPR